MDGFLLALHLGGVLKPPPTFRDRCFVTFYAGPMGLSLSPIRAPRRGGRAACQAALKGARRQPLRREGTHLAGSVCAIIVTYPMVQAAFSSSSLFIIISV